MRVLITGASGFIGQRLLRRLRDEPGVEVIGTCRNQIPQAEGCRWHQVDLSNAIQLEDAFRAAQPEVLVHLAALSDVDRCEEDPDLADETNVRGSQRVARLCARYSARLVFLSTDYVFDGERGRYREDEVPCPGSQYGKAKWEAEQAIARELTDWSVLRTCLVYGWPPAGCHGNLATGVISRLERGQQFNGYTDMYRTPTYVDDVVEGIWRLAQRSCTGVYHVAGLDWVNMYQFGEAVAQVFHLNGSLVQPALAPVEGSEGRRPKLLGLDSARTATRLGIDLSGVVSGLVRMREERREHF